MRISIPKVHGDSPREKLIRTLALVLIFALVAWAFIKNNERVLDTLHRQGTVYDETGVLSEEQRKFIVSFTRALKEEFGMNCRVQVFGGDFVVPELDAKTMYMGLAPAIGAVELRFPPMMSRALGPEFIESLKTEHLLPSLATDDWPMEIQMVLAAIYEKLTQLEGDTPGE
ncbi:hypothetical protein [Pseudodesulfovibrio pelocollis]|uniref:hypothetical protein n=1 Tax=Pseudodesulfovibrio pelocollis TaxID=3051432 RepID=UPI00255B1B36|nr:hypothetical protein [Pseudodesulfovibrio sp. SB368]